MATSSPRAAVVRGLPPHKSWQGKACQQQASSNKNLSHAHTQDPATPTIVLNVIKAEGVRQHKGRDPTPSMLIRVSIGGMAQPEVLKTSSVPAGVDQTW